MNAHVQHFSVLEEAAAFIGAGGARAVGFFSEVESIEHTVFLTVAKQLAQQPEISLTLGRTNVGRGTSGATIYLVPGGTAVARNGSVVPPLMLHTFRLPKSSEDSELLDHWRQRPRADADAESAAGASTAADATPPQSPPPTPTPPSPSPPPPPSAMWEESLEAEALALHRFLQRGSLADVSELSEASLEPLAASAHSLGLLLLPAAVGGKLRDYHLRRLSRTAARYPPVRCAAGAAGRERQDAWLQRPHCLPTPAPVAVRFGHARPSLELAALLTTRLGLPPSALPDATHDARFLLLRRNAAAADGKPWRAHVLAGTAAQAGVEALCERHLPAGALPTREKK